MNWQLWFVQLSGWPVFLTIVGIVAGFMLVLSVVLPRLANRSALENAVIATIATTVLVLILLGVAVFLSRA